MINYIWIGLIIIAVTFGAYKDVTKADPPWLDGRSEKAMLTSDELAADVFTDEWALDVVIDKDEALGAPAALKVGVDGAGIGRALHAEFTDADGETFLGQVSGKLGDYAEPTTQSLAFDSLVAVPDVPFASPDFPLTLTGLKLVSKDGATTDAPFTLASVGWSYDGKYTVGEDLESKVWMGVLTKSATRWAEISIELAIHLIGIMMLWLGLMRIAEEAGLVQLVARLVKPVMTLLFPNIPPEGEAMGAIVMNVAANMLGLGNAATPLGLKAMEELQKVNESKEYASNAMCMLLAINTSSVTIITPTIIGYRAAAGSGNLMDFWPAMIGATLFSTICAVLACKLLEGLPAFAIPASAKNADIANEEGKTS